MTPAFCARPAVRALLGCLTATLAACGGSDSQPASGTPAMMSGAEAYLYVASTHSDAQSVPQPGTVNGFAINSDGSLTPLTPTVTIGLPPTALVSDPQGPYVYAVNGDGSINAYSVQGRDGTLMPLGTALSTMEAASVQASIDPSGRFLYVVLQAANDVVAEHIILPYSIGSDGSLQPAGTPIDETASASSGALAFDASGQYAYLASTNPAGGSQISQYSIGSDGALSALTPASVPAPASIAGVTVTGESAYAVSTCGDSACDGEVSSYAVAAGGLMSASTSTSMLTPDYTIVPMELVLSSPSSAYLLGRFTAGDYPQALILPFAVDADTGALTPGSIAEVHSGLGAETEAIYTGSAPHLYVLSSAQALGHITLTAHTGGEIDHYLPGAAGVLTYSSSTLITGGRPVAMAIAVMNGAMPLTQ